MQFYMGLLHNELNIQSVTALFRYYSSKEILRLHRILALKQIGFSLNKIMEAVDNDMSPDRMREYLEGKKAAISRTIEDEQLKLNQVEAYLKIIRQEEAYMSYDVLLKELPEVIVASMRTVIPDYGTFNTIYPKMGRYMQEQNSKCAVPEYCFTIYHDGEYKEKDIDVEICQAVMDYGKDSEEIKFKKIAGIETAACVFHKGPYNTIGMAYGAIMRWTEENNYQVAGPPRESYIDGIWNKDNPEEWLTEVQVPVKLR